MYRTIESVKRIIKTLCARFTGVAEVGGTPDRVGGLDRPRFESRFYDDTLMLALIQVVGSMMLHGVELFDMLVLAALVAILVSIHFMGRIGGES